MIIEVGYTGNLSGIVSLPSEKFSRNLSEKINVLSAVVLDNAVDIIIF